MVRVVGLFVNVARAVYRPEGYRVLALGQVVEGGGTPASVETPVVWALPGRAPKSFRKNSELHRRCATALNRTVSAGKAPPTVNATAGTATNLSADKVDGKSGEDLVQLDPATAQNESLHVDGLVRSGSETGTSESPPPGSALGTRAS